MAYEFILCELEARDWCAVDCALTELATNKSTENIHIYPNPAKGQLTINASIGIDQITIYNSIGQYVLSTNETNIAINQLKLGIYIAYIGLSDQTYMTQKFVKQ